MKFVPMFDAFNVLFSYQFPQNYNIAILTVVIEIGRSHLYSSYLDNQGIV